MKHIVLSLSLVVFTTFAFAKKIKIEIVEMETTMGTIKLKMYDDAPKHGANFLKLCKEGFYDSLLFHRIIPAFMIQGGDPNSKRAEPNIGLGNGDVGYKIDAELLPSRHHKYGTLCAARDNNPEKASSGCQFYIVVGKKLTDAELDNLDTKRTVKYTPQQRLDYKTLGGTPFLDMNYTVFGEVMEGMDVVEKIIVAPKAPGDRPTEDIRMLKVSVKTIKVKI
jgi:peptidyl-prolyl cis-trans isomerase B (cyclophilin B)